MEAAEALFEEGGEEDGREGEEEEGAENDEAGEEDAEDGGDDDGDDNADEDGDEDGDEQAEAEDGDEEAAADAHSGEGADDNGDGAEPRSRVQREESSTDIAVPAAAASLTAGTFTEVRGGESGSAGVGSRWIHTPLLLGLLERHCHAD